MAFERINKKTPSGGDYSIAFFYNDKGEDVPKDKAAKVIIREMKSSGEIINDIFAVIDPDE